MDFIHDRLADGRTVRILSAVDVHTRECVDLQAQLSSRGEGFGPVLSRVTSQRLLPPVISVDRGTEFTSKALDYWGYRNEVQVDFIRPESPQALPKLSPFALADSFVPRVPQYPLRESP